MASIQSRALGFHVLTENGAVIWRLPLHALCHKEDAPLLPLVWLDFWDCFSYKVSCTTFDRLREMRVRVQLKDRSWVGGQYMFTLDWHDSEDAEEAGDGGHKCARSTVRTGSEQHHWDDLAASRAPGLGMGTLRSLVRSRCTRESSRNSIVTIDYGLGGV